MKPFLSFFFFHFWLLSHCKGGGGEFPYFTWFKTKRLQHCVSFLKSKANVTSWRGSQDASEGFGEAGACPAFSCTDGLVRVAISLEMSLRPWPEAGKRQHLWISPCLLLTDIKCWVFKANLTQSQPFILKAAGELAFARRRFGQQGFLREGEVGKFQQRRIYAVSGVCGLVIFLENVSLWYLAW